METGNEDAVYAAVGRALVNWYSVEVELCRVFCQASYPERFHPLFSDSPLAQAFWTMRSAEMRLNATTKMIDASEYGALFGDEWKAIDRKVRASSRKRNKIAHGSLCFHNGVGDNGELETQYRFISFFRAKGTSALKRADIFEADWLPTSEIQKAAEEFRELAQDINRLVVKVQLHFIPDNDDFLGRLPVG